jgi:hypothetical protein
MLAPADYALCDARGQTERFHYFGDTHECLARSAVKA